MKDTVVTKKAPIPSNLEIDLIYSLFVSNIQCDSLMN